MLHFFKITIYVVGSNALMLFKKHFKAEVSTDIGMLSRSARYGQLANSFMGNRSFLEPKIWLIHIRWFASTVSLIAKNDYTSFLAANMMMAMDYIPRKMPKLIATNMAIQQPTRHGTPMDVLFFGKRLSGHCRHIWLSVGNAIR